MSNTRKFYNALLILAFLVCHVSGVSVLAQNSKVTFTITSPYADVDWDSFGRYKAAFHVHTRNSDGGQTTAEMLERHYTLGFNIVGLTDHNFLTGSWNTVTNGLTTARMEAMARGDGRGGRGMIGPNNSIEHSDMHHVNSFFVASPNSRWPGPANLQAGGVTALRNVLAEIERLGGISRINHPGRYTGGQSGDAAGSNNLAHINAYVGFFMDFPSNVGMEIINKLDNESRSDRILWDNILMRTMPHGRGVWGFADDDSHSTNAVGFAYNTFLMPELSQANIRDTMVSGAFYAVSRVARREGVNATLPGGGTTPNDPVSSTNFNNTRFMLDQTAPSISSIRVNEQNGTITIVGANYARIEWIADGRLVHTGNTLDLGAHQENVNSYVRAQLISSSGIAFTQPFGIRMEVVPTCPPGTCSHEVVDIVPPTCTTDGYTVSVCTECGDEEIGDVVPALGHHYDDDNPIRRDDGFWWVLCQRPGCGDEKKYDRGEVTAVKPAATVKLLPNGRVLLTVKVEESFGDGKVGSFERTFTVNRNTMRTFNVGGIQMFVDTRIANPRLWELRGITEIPVARIVVMPGFQGLLSTGFAMSDILAAPGMPDFLAVSDGVNEHVIIENGEFVEGWNECPDTGLLNRSPHIDLTHLDLTGEDIVHFLPSDVLRLLLFTGFTYHDLFEADTITGTPNSLILTDGMDSVTIIDEGDFMPGWYFDCETELLYYFSDEDTMAATCTILGHCFADAIPYRCDDGWWWLQCNYCNEGKIYDRGEVIDVTASAIVTLTAESRNILTVTVVEEYCDGTFGRFERVFSVNSNAMTTFDVAGYSIFVDTRVSNQALLRLRNITEFEATRVVIND